MMGRVVIRRCKAMRDRRRVHPKEKNNILTSFFGKKVSTTSLISNSLSNCQTLATNPASAATFEYRDQQNFKDVFEKVMDGLGIDDSAKAAFFYP